jgi:hypothetical protein
MRAELASQGILGPNAAQRQVRMQELMIFPDMLFVPNHLGTLLNSLYPHALLVLVLFARPLGLPTEPALWWWVGAVFLGMECNVQRVDGYWVTGFRNFRHAHVFVYPVILLLAGYLSGLRARFPRVATACAAALVATAVLQSVQAATISHVAYDDGRAACRFLETAPPGRIYLDDVLRWRCATLAPDAMRRWSVRPIPADPAQRAKALAALDTGYVITGGGREPFYGGTGVIPLARELPPGRATLVSERGGPLGPAWRPEPFRIWKVG